MSLEEKAKQIRSQANEIATKANFIMDLCNKILEQYQLNGVTIEYSATQKQQIIDHYRTLKTKLKVLVEELP